MSELSFEGALLHLVIEGDLATAQRRILMEMLPGEQRRLMECAETLALLCRAPGFIREALAAGCGWKKYGRRCEHTDVIGYYETDSGYFDYHGVCSVHKPEIEALGFTVYAPPTEVVF